MSARDNACWAALAVFIGTADRWLQRWRCSLRFVVGRGLCWLATFSATSAAFAGYSETFQSYPIGTGVVYSSSPVWQYWGSPPPASGNDALVVADPTNSSNHVLNITNNGGNVPDVTTSFANLLGSGFKAELSFNVYMTSANEDAFPQVNLGPSALSNGDYSQTLLMFLNDNGNNGNSNGMGPSLTAAGQIMVDVNGVLGVVGSYLPDAWHHVEVDLLNTGGVGGPLTFSFKVDGVLSATTAMTTLAAGGITTLEASAFATNNNLSSFVLIDNIQAYSIPEPSSIALALVGLVAMFGYGSSRRRPSAARPATGNRPKSARVAGETTR